MSKRIEVGEKVIAQICSSGRYGTRQAIGTLRQRPTDPYEPYLVHIDGDPDGTERPAFAIRRTK